MDQSQAAESVAQGSGTGAGDEQKPGSTGDQVDPETLDTTGNVIKLPDALGIRNVAEWQAHFAATLPTSGALELDACELEHIDGAGLQLLCAVAKEATARYISVSWRRVPNHLTDAADCLGLKQIRTLVGDAVRTLQASFEGLLEQSTEQQRLVVTTINDLSQDNKETDNWLSFDAFAKETDNIVNYLIENILSISQNSMMVMESIQEMAEQMEQVDGLLGDVKQIADQTNLLALNAAIEAARAGEAGRGFAVVAEEVRNLSVRSNRFSDQIKELLSGSKRRIDEARATLEKLASRDMNFALESKSHVDGMVDKLNTINARLAGSLGKVAATTSEIDKLVGNAVRSLQFEDMVSQLSVYSVNKLGEIEATMEALKLPDMSGGTANPEQLSELIKELRSIQDRLKADFSLEQQSDKPVAQFSMTEGEVELF